MDDFLVLSYLSPNIESRLGFRSEFNKRLFDSVDIDEILNNDSEDTFYKTVVMNYLLKHCFFSKSEAIVTVLML